MATERDPDLPLLTEDDIRGYTDAGSFSRDRSYLRGRMLTRTVRRGNVLSGISEGSSGGPYAVQAMLGTGDEKIADWGCTCPRGGFCKHIVALLLAWVADPSAFAPRPTLEELLGDHDRAALIALIRKLIALDPELEPALERFVQLAPPVIAPASPGAGPARTLSTAAIRQALEEAIAAGRGAGDGWGWYAEGDPEAWERVADAFYDATETGARFERVGRLADAAAVWATVAAVGIERTGELYDDARIDEQIVRANDGLAAILARQEELPDSERLTTGQRDELVDVLYDLALFFGPSPEVPGESEDGGAGHRTARLLSQLLAGAARERIERRWRVEAARAGASAESRALAIEFGQAFSGPKGLPDDELLALYAEAGLAENQAFFLLERGRIDEAIAVAIRHVTQVPSVLAFVAQLEQSGPEGLARAIRFIDERLWECEGTSAMVDASLRAWLAEAYLRAGAADKALAPRERMFLAQPHRGTYEELMQTAKGVPSRASEVRARALATLLERGNPSAVLEILLAEGKVAEALDLYRRETAKPSRPKPGERWYAPPGVRHKRPELAKAAELDFPDEAIRLHRELADESIAQRTRNAYREGTTHLAAVHRLLTASGREAE